MNSESVQPYNDIGEECLGRGINGDSLGKNQLDVIK